jgi:hypothetical protein
MRSPITLLGSFFRTRLNVLDSSFRNSVRFVRRCSFCLRSLFAIRPTARPIGFVLTKSAYLRAAVRFADTGPLVGGSLFRIFREGLGQGSTCPSCYTEGSYELRALCGCGPPRCGVPVSDHCCIAAEWQSCRFGRRFRWHGFADGVRASRSSDRPFESHHNRGDSVHDDVIITGRPEQSAIPILGECS